MKCLNPSISLCISNHILIPYNPLVKTRAQWTLEEYIFNERQTTNEGGENIRNKDHSERRKYDKTKYIKKCGLRNRKYCTCELRICPKTNIPRTTTTKMTSIENNLMETKANSVRDINVQS